MLSRRTHITIIVILTLLLAAALAVARGKGLLGSATSASLPDYVVEEIRVLPSPVQAGNPYTIHAVVRNLGAAGATRGSYVQVSIDADNDGDWDTLGIPVILAALPAGASQEVRWENGGETPQVDWQPQVGMHRIRICAAIPTEDADFQVQEADTLNNCSETTVTVLTKE
ncbi:MAG: CARDB domain-containing protein [Candidatus Peribacteraceae bacterium]|jgi:hypothetical protein